MSFAPEGCAAASSGETAFPTLPWLSITFLEMAFLTPLLCRLTGFCPFSRAACRPCLRVRHPPRGRRLVPSSAPDPSDWYRAGAVRRRVFFSVLFRKGVKSFPRRAVESAAASECDAPGPQNEKKTAPPQDPLGLPHASGCKCTVHLKGQAPSTADCWDGCGCQKVAEFPQGFPQSQSCPR